MILKPPSFNFSLIMSRPIFFIPAPFFIEMNFPTLESAKGFVISLKPISFKIFFKSGYFSTRLATGSFILIFFILPPIIYFLIYIPKGSLNVKKFFKNIFCDKIKLYIDRRLL